MNAELARIRRGRGYKEEIRHEAVRVQENHLTELMRELNLGMKDLYFAINDEKIDYDFLARILSNNIYIILNAFNEMGIYPDYFFEQVLNNEKDFQQELDENSELKNDYEYVTATEDYYDFKLYKIIEKGINNGYGRIQAYDTKDVNDDVKDMINYYETYHVPYNIQTEEQCRNTLKTIHFYHAKNINHLQLSDLLSDDVLCLTKLLVLYLSFFVSMGIPPKKYIDECIDTIGKETTKTK